MPLTIIGDAGHWAIAQRPHAVAAALHAFWNSL
jgi:pimeloyl-ACP methyl ester carboxylesterase